MKTYLVTFIFDDSSTENSLVNAKNEKSAVNTVINYTKSSRQPKFAIVEQQIIEENCDDLNLIADFEEHSDNVYTFKNKLSEVIEVGGFCLSLGSLIGFKEV